MRSLGRDSICFKARIEKVFQELKSILSENKKLIVSSSLTNMLAYYFRMLSIRNKRLTFISQSWNLLFFPLDFSPFCSLWTTECPWVQNRQQSCSRCEHSPILCPRRTQNGKIKLHIHALSMKKAWKWYKGGLKLVRMSKKASQTLDFWTVVIEE